ncbi:hypothetical protein [Ostreiculturibacter nitratireducens]|uniref:hypothetical protein n=1 Tax=Ostreiculturibacter nitratireducens TaxID=3075226 RepID=UPI0031B5F1EF
MSRGLAGRAPEGLLLGNISSGAGGSDASDLARATALAASLDDQLGLGAHGPVWLGQRDRGRIEDPADLGRIRARLERSERHATEILEAHRGLLSDMAKELVAMREIAGEELDRWLEQILDDAASAALGPQREAASS